MTTITYSAELLRNFLQDDVLAPDAKFEALQTSAGAALLFSVGSDNVLYLTREVSGTRTGWTRDDISSALIARDFGGGPGAMCVDFATAQHAATAQNPAIQLAMVVTDGTSDHLYLSLGNSDADTSWVAAPAWTAYPYDNPDHKLSSVKIVNVFLSEATDHEYIVVDVLRDPESTGDLMYRYYIDPVAAAKPGGYAWHPHNLAIDLSATGYTSCLGRKAKDTLDGLYTAGQVSGHAQLVYQPLYNPYGTTAPPASRFSLPGGRTVEAMAACRNPGNTSDLYLTSGTGLYYLAAASQLDGAVAVQLADNAMFDKVKTLFAAALPNGGGVILWGLNGVNEVFYTTCTSGKPAAGPWSVPLPIVIGAEQISPYLDRVADANTFFCHTGVNRIAKVVKSPDTKIWTSHDITLDPPATTTKARDVSTYSTRIQVTDDAGSPLTGFEVSIEATNITSLYINYLHYKAGTAAIPVLTDSTGTITIIEPVDSLAGSQLTVTAGDARVAINPMDNAFRKAAGLSTAADLSAAVITSPDGSTRPLCSAGASQADLQTVADSNQTLGQAYDAHTSDPQSAAPQAAPRAAAHAIAPRAAAGFDWPSVDVGDLLNAIGNAIEKTILDDLNILWDATQEAWKLMVIIGGQPFQAVLNDVVTIVKSAGHLLSMIVEYVKDVIEFLEFLFEWGDIARTKDVYKTMMKAYLGYAVGQLATLRSELDQQIRDAEVTIADWAQLGTGSATAMSADASDPGASGSMLGYHYQNNADQTTLLGPLPAAPPDTDSGQGLAGMPASDGDTLSEAMDQLVDLGNRMSGMSLPDVLTEVTAILGETVLESARSVIDVMFDMIGDTADAALEMLDIPIHIPVVSDVLNFFGVPDFSLLDLMCWLGAIPATLMYKIVAQRAPFPDDQQTAELIAATDWSKLLAMFGQPAPALHAMAASARMPETARAGFFSGHCFSGFFTLVGIEPTMKEALEPAEGNPWSMEAGVTAVLGGASQGVAAYVANKAVPIVPIDNFGVSILNDALICAHVITKLVGAFVCRVWGQDPGRWYGKMGRLNVADKRGGFAAFDAFLAICNMIPVLWHFGELAKKPHTTERQTAIVDEASNVGAIISRISYGVAVNLPAPDKPLPVLVLGVTNLVTVGLQWTECGLVMKLP